MKRARDTSLCLAMRYILAPYYESAKLQNLRCNLRLEFRRTILSRKRNICQKTPAIRPQTNNRLRNMMTGNILCQS